MFTITPSAAAQILTSAQQSGVGADMGLRIAAKQTADGSIEYGIGFDHQTEEDERIVSEGVVLLIAAVHQPLLQDAVMDFVELEPGRFSFIFLNPSDPHYVPPQGARA